MTWKERFAAMRTRTKVVLGLGVVGAAVTGVLAYLGKTKAALVALAFTLGLFVAGGIMWHEDIQDSARTITLTEDCLARPDGSLDCKLGHNVLTNQGQVLMQKCFATLGTTGCMQGAVDVVLIQSGGPSSNAQYLLATYAQLGGTLVKPSGNGYADVTGKALTTPTVSATNNCYSNTEKCSTFGLATPAVFNGTTTSPAWSATHAAIVVPSASALYALFPLNGGAGRTLNNGDTLTVGWSQALALYTSPLDQMLALMVDAWDSASLSNAEFLGYEDAVAMADAPAGELALQ